MFILEFKNKSITDKVEVPVSSPVPFPSRLPAGFVSIQSPYIL